MRPKPHPGLDAETCFFRYFDVNFALLQKFCFNCFAIPDPLEGGFIRFAFAFTEQIVNQ